MDLDELIAWLSKRDVCIQRQVHRHMLNTIREGLCQRIETESWGALFLSKKKPGRILGRKVQPAQWGEQMVLAIRVSFSKSNKVGSWNVRAKHPRRVHFEMEKTGKPSRWKTLRALRVLNHDQFIN